MRHNLQIIQRTKDAQARVFRLCKRDHDLTLKAISLDSGVDYDSLCNYAKGETQMPVAVLYALIGVVPDHLLSLLLPEGRSIVAVPENVDHDALCDLAEAYAREKLAAHRADSECQERLGPGELDRLNRKVVELRARAA